MKIDDYGRTIISIEEAFDSLMQDKYSLDFFVEDSEELAQYNRLCVTNDKSDFTMPIAEPLGDVADFHREKSNQWNIPEPFASIDLREYLYGLCETEDQISRVLKEMDLYEARGLTELLRLLIYLVDHFRKNKIVWGVGRGSSVASYVLFLIGINKIDPLKFGLGIEDFLK